MEILIVYILYTCTNIYRVVIPSGMLYDDIWHRRKQSSFTQLELVSDYNV